MIPRIAALLGLAAMGAVGGEAGLYRAKATALDAGGGNSASAHYRSTASLGPLGGTAHFGTSLKVASGYVGLLDEPPVVQGDTLRKGSGLEAKVQIANLLANDSDPEGYRLQILAFDPVSEQCGRVKADQGWLIYQAPATAPISDRFAYWVQDQAGNKAAAWVAILTRDTGIDPSANLLSVLLLSDGHVRIVFVGIPRRRYRIEWADELPARRWQALASVTADVRGRIQADDRTEPRPAQRYFRTVEE